MSPCTAFDSVLASLARPFPRSADTLLDLREWAADEERVGSCVKAYFDLYEAAPGEDPDRVLSGFRGWLESHLEIVVRDGRSEACLETWPLTLEGESDLEGFCRRTMDRLREDRCLAASVVHLGFRFRTALAA